MYCLTLPTRSVYYYPIPVRKHNVLRYDILFLVKWLLLKRSLLRHQIMEKPPSLLLLYGIESVRTKFVDVVRMLFENTI